MSASTPKLMSFLIPSRSRCDQLCTIIEEMLDQAGPDALPHLEFLIKFDTDDAESISKLASLPHDRVAIKTIISDRLGGYKDVFRFYNDLARISTGMYLIIWNDDARFKTQNWFEVFREETSKAQTAYSYWFGGTPTTIYEEGKEPRVGDWPSFIAHHRKLYDIIGFYSGIGAADAFLSYVLSPLNLLMKIDAIQIDHQPWFQIPEEERDQVSRDNAEPGAVAMTDMRIVQLSQKKIVQYVKQQQQAQAQAQARMAASRSPLLGKEPMSKEPGKLLADPKK